MVKKGVEKGKKKAQVWVVPSDETASGKHEVVFAPDGDLNKAAKLGNIKSFAKWSDAVGFAHEKGVELGAEVAVHSYTTNPYYAVKYRSLRPKAPRITPKSPSLQR